MNRPTANDQRPTTIEDSVLPSSIFYLRSSTPVHRSSFASRLQQAEQPMTKLLQHSYLLRLWHDHAAVPMRATLIAVKYPDKPRHFANLDELFTFLIAHADPVTLADDRPEWDGDYCTPDDPC
jgi:hypothetical protein